MPARKNLLMIWTDEQRADTMACYGNTAIHAPNLNRLADESFVFEHAYCVQPVCTPSRGSIMTGLWPHLHGAWTNNAPLHADARTLGELVAPEYRRAYHGKWHLGDEIVAQHGFDEWVSIEDSAYRPYYTKPEYLEGRSDYHRYLVANGFPPDQKTPDGARCFSRHCAALMAEPFTKAGFLGQRAKAFLEEHDPERPFVLSINFLEPHMPFYGPLNAVHNPDDLPVGPAFTRPPPENASLRNRACAARYSGGFGNLLLRDDDDWRRLRANYHGLVTMVDNAVGVILDALEKSGMADDTIVVFTSDHGDMMGDHAQLAKCVMYEEAIRIPWLIRVPWLAREQTMIPGRVSHIDLLPTLLDLMEQPIPEHLQGLSLKPTLKGDADLSGNDVFVIWRGDELSCADVEVPGAGAAEIAAISEQEWVTLVSHDGWKLNLCTLDPCCELYDLNSDPHELVNRYDEPGQFARIREMTGRIVVWQEQTGSTIPLPKPR